jgi:hypothetical protein
MSTERDTFNTIVSDITGLEVSLGGVQVKLFNGNSVCLDTKEGSDMKDVLLRAYAGARADVHATLGSGLVFSKGRAIANAMFEAMESSSPIKKEAYVGVFGLGIIALGDYISSESKIITHKHTIFGRVHGTTYGELFKLSTHEIERAMLTDDLIVEADTHHGGLLVLKDVTVCESKAPGLVMRRDTVAFVPIHTHTLQIGSAYTEPIDS